MYVACSCYLCSRDRVHRFSIHTSDCVFLATSGGPGLQRSIYKSVWGGHSSSWEAFQVDVEARTSNTAVLFAGVYLTVGSLRDPFRKSISTSSTIPKLLSHFHHPMTSVPIGAAGTSARRGGSEERLEIVSGLCGITGSTSLKRTGRAIARPVH